MAAVSARQLEDGSPGKACEGSPARGQEMLAGVQQDAAGISAAVHGIIQLPSHPEIPSICYPQLAPSVGSQCMAGTTHHFIYICVFYR